MAQPELVESRLGDEEVVATVSLAGEDRLVVTPTRSLCYRGEGLISDESVEEYPHDASRLTIDQGRRKVKIRFEYPIQDDRTLAVPESVLDSVLHYVLAGVLNARGVTVDGEIIRRVFRFNELTLVITDRQLVTHVGEALWDDDYDQFRYDELTGIEFEEGSLATQVAFYMGGRSQRIKAPTDRSAELKQELTGALATYFDVADLAELDELLGGDEEAEPAAATSGLNFSGDIEPIDAGGPADDDGPADVEWPSGDGADTTDQASASVDAPEQSVDDTATDADTTDSDREDLRTAIADLRDAIDAHRELLDAQAEALDELSDAIERDG